MPEVVETVGVVEKILGNNNYLVEIRVGEEPQEVLCHLSGKMRRFRISIVMGDEVTVEIPPPYNQGRITFRGVKKERGAPEKQKRTKQRKRPKGRGGRRR